MKVLATAYLMYTEEAILRMIFPMHRYNYNAVTKGVNMHDFLLGKRLLPLMILIITSVVTSVPANNRETFVIREILVVLTVMREAADDK